MRRCYKIEEDYYYGDILGIFVCDEKYIKFMLKHKMTLRLGEVLGKYSDIVFECESKSDFKVISSKKDELEILKKAEIGFNPLQCSIYESYITGKLAEYEKIIEQYVMEETTVQELYDFLEKENLL